MDCNMSPKDLITEEVVVDSVKADYGPNAKLLSWNLQDFVHSCDRDSSYVTSILANISVDGIESQHSYIAKLNPCRKDECWKCVTHSVFIREEYFLHDISPRLCNILRSYNLHPLRLPIDLYASCAIGKEILISKDLREDDFVMADRKSGLDVPHAKLVIHELARLHAASFLLEEQNIGEEMQDMYPFLQEEWGDEHHVYYNMFDKYTQNQFKNAIEMLKACGGYNDTIKWMGEVGNNIQNILKGQLQNTEDKFKVICHGDMQINNFLFKYDNQHNPIDVMLLDLQRARVSSIASDLNYFLYTSLDGKTRKDNLDILLQEYYNSYAKVMMAARIPMKFNIEELHEEFHSKNILGFIYGLNAGIALLLEPDACTFEDYRPSTLDNSKLHEILQDDMFINRVKSLVDEMIEFNLIQQ